MKVVAYEVEPWERGWFERLARSREHRVVCVEEPLDADASGIAEDTEAVTTFIYSRLGRDVLDRLPRLRLIATRSTGYDHVDLAACRERGITVCNVPDYGQNTVAEHVFGLLLTIAHRLDQAVDRTRRGDFSLKGLQGFDLHGKTIGVVGTGQIGRCTARIARGFGMEVLAHDLHPDPELAGSLGLRYVEFDELLEHSDVVSLHLPSTRATRHMLSWPQFERMKRGAVLINTARGDLVDMQALVRALAEGRLAAAGLDVLPEEPTIREEAELLRSVYQKGHDLETLLANHVLLRLRNVIVTPHSAFNTREAVHRIIDTTVENIEAFAEGRPRNVVGAE